METEIKQLHCGQCGEARHLVYERSNGEIIVECIACKSSSEIVITKPEIRINNNSGLGTICHF